MSVIADWMVDLRVSCWISSPCFTDAGCFSMDLTWVEAADEADDVNEDFCTDCCWKLEPNYIHNI